MDATTIRERIARIGWTERLVVPELGPCHEWKGAKIPKGYGHLKWNGKATGVHRLSLQAKLGRPLRPDMLACHTCDNPPCVREDHLFEGTPTSNQRDRRVKGRGVKHPLSTYQAFVELVAARIPAKEIARVTGFSLAYVYYLRNGEMDFPVSYQEQLGMARMAG